MIAPLTTDRLRDESGFTLVELLVAMSLTVIVLFAILNILDSFTANAARQTKITAANEQVRHAMDRIVRDLRHAAAIEVADPVDLVYTVTDSATKFRRERICIDADSRLWRSSVTTTTPPATPISSATSCPTADSAAAQITPLLSANTDTNPLFTYDSPSPATVRSVGLTFALNAGNAARSDVSTLRASAFVRAQSETALAVDEDEIATTCSSSGDADGEEEAMAPTLTLSAGVGPLTVTYTDVDGNTLGTAAAGSAKTLPSGQTIVVATITATSGAVTQIVKKIAC